MSRRIFVRSALLAMLVALLAAVLWVSRPAGPPQLGGVDPQKTADLELEMWQAYYRKEKARLFELLVITLRLQHGYSWATAIESGFYLARAAAEFGDLRAGYDSVLPDLERGYGVLKEWTGAPFDVDALAKAELAWWVARRTPGQNSAANVGRLIGEEYLTLYGDRIDRAGALRAGALRAEAAALRDAGGLSADWPKVQTLLRESYTQLAAALH